MKDRYDKMISDEFSSKLDNIHASEDLILKTLAAIEKECGEQKEETADNTTKLTAIDQNYVAGYIYKMSRKTHIRIIALSVAAAAAMVFGGMFFLKRTAIPAGSMDPSATTYVVTAGAATPSATPAVSSQRNSNAIVPLGATYSTNNYFTARSISNRPGRPMPEREEKNLEISPDWEP